MTGELGNPTCALLVCICILSQYMALHIFIPTQNYGLLIICSSSGRRFSRNDSRPLPLPHRHPKDSSPSLLRLSAIRRFPRRLQGRRIRPGRLCSWRRALLHFLRVHQSLFPTKARCCNISRTRCVGELGRAGRTYGCCVGRRSGRLCDPGADGGGEAKSAGATVAKLSRCSTEYMGAEKAPRGAWRHGNRWCLEGNVQRVGNHRVSRSPVHGHTVSIMGSYEGVETHNARKR